VHIKLDDLVLLGIGIFIPRLCILFRVIHVFQSLNFPIRLCPSDIVLWLFDGDDMVGMQVRRTVMLKIQKTTVSQVEGEKAILGIQISDHEDVDKSEQYVVLSVLIDRPATAHEFESMQLRALGKANDLVDQVARAIEKSRPNR